MSRVHIFDILSQEVNFLNEYFNILSLLNEKLKYESSDFRVRSISIFDVIENSFRGWKSRGTYLSFAELLKDIERKKYDFEIQFFLLAELFINLVQDKILSANTQYGQVNSFITKQMNSIVENINQVLERSGYCCQKIDGKVYILEKRAEAITVAEITNDYQVLEYNRFDLKGNLNRKMAIINHLYKHFEPKRKNLEDKEFKSIYDDYAFLANTFSRHNSDESLRILQTNNLEVEVILDNAYDLYLNIILIDNYLKNIKEPVRLLKQSLKATKQ